MGVVVTGLGVVSALGGNVDAFHAGLVEGRNPCRMHEFPRMDGSVVTAPAYIAVDADPEGLIEPRKLRRMFRLVRMSAVAARQALRHAGLDPATMDSSRLGVVFGTSFGAMEVTQKFVDSWLANGEQAASPLQFMNSVHGIMASQIALDINATGVNLTTAQRDICFEAALSTAADLLEHDRADVILVGGADELTPVLHEFGTRMLQFESDTSEGIDPSGTHPKVVPGDGAGVVVLEREGTRRKPLARVLAAGVGRHDTGGEDVAMRAWNSSGLDNIAMVTNNRDGSQRGANVHAKLAARREPFGASPVSHLGSFGAYASAGAQQFIANVLMLSGNEFFAPLAKGRPSGQTASAPGNILHDAPSISGNHAAYVLGRCDNNDQ